MFKRLIHHEFSHNRQHAVNVTASLINMMVTLVVGLWLSPFIVRTIGVEANGFVTLANNFIAYATVIRSALNSMGSRFLTMAYYRNDKKKFETYYSSLFFADLILAIVLGFVGAACVWKLEVLLEIPENLVSDVKILFAVLFANFIIATILTVWSASAYIKNKLYLDSITSALGSVVRACMIVGLFFCIATSSVSFVGIGTLVSGLVTYCINFCYKKELFPTLKVKTQNFSIKAVGELLFSGMWNSLSDLGTMLTSSLDLLVVNLLISAAAMGVYSVAGTMPAYVNNIVYAVASVFIPSFIIDYAQNHIDNIVKTVKQSSKLIAVICTLPLGFLLVYGKEFYALWQPTQDAEILYRLSVIIIFGRVFFTGAEPLFHLFTVTNKVRQNAIVTLANGVVSILLTLFVINVTNLGIYAVAGVSVICCWIKNMLFVVPYSAHYLGLKKTTFYNTVLYSVVCTGIVVGIGFVEKQFLRGQSWPGIILAGAVLCIAGGCATTLIILNKYDRKVLFSKVGNLFKKVKK